MAMTKQRLKLAIDCWVFTPAQALFGRGRTVRVARVKRVTRVAEHEKPRTPVSADRIDRGTLV
ncbi:hypothetical protein [Streptomyces mirabilis]|uniref:hypothetical protein n=1 Tax=Streptomyces mirabilis TaxID=68239 RepID=UPI0033BD64CC